MKKVQKCDTRGHRYGENQGQRRCQFLMGKQIMSDFGGNELLVWSNDNRKNI